MDRKLLTHENRTAILAGMRKILSSSTRWTKGYMALDENSASVYADAPTASCYCLLGAYIVARTREVGNDVDYVLDPWLYERHRKRFPDWDGDIACWNDHPETEYEDVVAFLTE